MKKSITLKTPRILKKKKKEIPVGGTGVIDGRRVMAKRYDDDHFYDGCDRCCFGTANGYDDPCPTTKCRGKYRSDKTEVYFVEVKEP